MQISKLNIWKCWLDIAFVQIGSTLLFIYDDFFKNIYCILQGGVFRQL